MPSPFARHGVWRTWTTLDGLPSLQLHAAAEDGQGYLWLATAANGLCRFDGEDFLPFTTANGLPTNRIYALLADRQDRLWIGAMVRGGGLTWYDGGQFHPLAETQGITALAEDQEGRTWFCGDDYMGYYDGAAVHGLSDGFVRSHGTQETTACWGIVPDVEGQVWFGAGSLVGYDGTAFHCYRDDDLPVPHEDNVAIGRHPHGGLWVGWGRRV